MDNIAIGIMGCAALMGLFLTGIEMAFAMTIIGVVGYAILVSPSAAFNMLTADFRDIFETYSLTVLPLFVFMGQVAFNAGIARRLYESAYKFFGHIPGGLSIATVVGATVFKSICGSSIATVVTFASVAVPQMDHFGYSKKLSTGIVATVGAIGVLLPPSIVLIALGIVTQQSIGRLFLAGIIPALMLGVGFIAVIFIWARINPNIGPATKTCSLKEKMQTVPNVIWPIVIFVIVIGGMLKGFFTPTEGASIGALAVLLLCMLKRDIKFVGIKTSLHEALQTTCMVILLVAASVVLGRFIAVTNIPAAASEWVKGLPFHRHYVMVIVFLIYLFGGSIIDDIAFLILATPIFFPAIIDLGYDPIWVCTVLAMTVCIGAVIPPVAMCVFVVKKITHVPLGIIYSGVYPFLIAMITCIILLFIFPGLATYLPSALMD
ncbi:MAG: TRAP transporter large permease [Deltaproteobacteria bacterium]|nr:TRAP transporter large permease [Deltaproteobacteria bacterium]